MKFYNCDWAMIIKYNKLWEQLPSASREFFLDKFNDPAVIVPKKKSSACVALIKSGFIKYYGIKTGLRIVQSREKFHQAVCSMDEYHLFNSDIPSTDDLIKYIRHNYSLASAVLPLSENLSHNWKMIDIASKISSLTWIKSFLHETHLHLWNAKFKTEKQKQSMNLFESTNHFEIAKQILRSLMDNSNPVYFTDLINKKYSDDELGKAIHLLLNYMLLFPALDRKSRLIQFGIWPPIHNFLHGVKHELLTVDCAVVPISSFLMDDMVTILIETSANPIPLKQNNREMYASSVSTLENNLSPISPLALTIVKAPSDIRIPLALQELYNQKLAKCNQIKGSLYCSITPRGTKWLDKSNSNRLKHYLTNLRKTILTHDSQDKATIKTLLKSHEPARLYLEEWPQRANKYLDLRGAAFSAFNAFLDWDLPVSLNSFIQIQCNNNNPLLRLFHAGVPLIVIHDYYDIFLDTPNEIIDYWKDRLMSFMLNVMLPLGCFSFGTDQASGQTVLSLSDNGKFLLGKLDSIQTNENDSPNIIVQPNFEIVFLNNFASAEAKLVRLAQRVGINVGTLFKLTRESIFNAVENGMNAATIIQTLTDVSCKPLPGNVEEQLKSWVKQCRHISVSHPVMLQCPDKETVLRIKAVGGIKVSVISDTIATISNRKDLKPLMKKFNKKGIFRE